MASLIVDHNNYDQQLEMLIVIFYTHILTCIFSNSQTAVSCLVMKFQGCMLICSKGITYSPEQSVFPYAGTTQRTADAVGRNHSIQRGRTG